MKRALPQFPLRLARDDRGVTALLFGLLLVPLLLAVGVGVDYARATQMRTMLQSTVDGAAISGAAAYISPAAATTAQSLAQAYVTKGTGALPSSVTVTSTTITPGSSGSGNSTAYTMYVSVTISVPTTLMYPLKPALTVTASATAKNPVVSGTFNTGGFSSNACDNNKIYWYVVPADGSVPAASAMNLLWDNNNPNPPSNVSFNVAASAKIGFALSNATAMGPGCNYGGWNYGNNAYGAHPGDTQWFYSHLQPPSLQFNTAPGGASTGSHGNYPSNEDCSLVVEKGTYSNGKWTYPSAPQGSCYTASGSGETYNTYDGQGNMNGTTCCHTTSGQTMPTMMTNAAPTCAQLNGISYQYDWNDMGWSFDSINYGNDMQYSFTCSGGSGSGNGTTTSGVILTN